MVQPYFHIDFECFYTYVAVINTNHSSVLRKLKKSWCLLMCNKSLKIQHAYNIENLVKMCNLLPDSGIYAA
jgi:hypothetical protein